MRIGVLTFNASPGAEPQHFISRPLAARFCAYRHNGKIAAASIPERSNVISIQVDLAFSKLKTLLRPPRNFIPCILPPRRPENLLLHYPLPRLESWAVSVRY